MLATLFHPTNIKQMTEILHTGDNLEYMQTLPSESIDLIYSDILYGTGRDFGNYKDIKANRKDVEEFYIPHIKEMHRLLKKTGSIYLQMDTRINHYIRLILENIFGVKNFINEIVWKKRNNTNNIETNYFNLNHDLILWYSKSKNYIFNNAYLPLSSETIKRYNRKDENGFYCLQPIYNKSGNYNKYTTLTLNGKEYKGFYSWTQKTLDKRLQENYIVEENTNEYLCYRKYLQTSKGSQISDVWTDLIEGSGIKREYQTQKSIELMSRIIKASSNVGDVCADFFCGSGSFGVAAKKLNRNVILNDINPEAIKLSQKRLNDACDLFNCC